MSPIRGYGTDAGTFAIPNVPNGSYLLQTGALYAWASQSAIDMGYFQLGRPGLTPLIENLADGGVQPTTITFNATNLQPWDSNNGWLELLAPDDNSWYFAISPWDPHPRPLATRRTPATPRWWASRSTWRRLGGATSRGRRSSRAASATPSPSVS